MLSNAFDFFPSTYDSQVSLCAFPYKCIKKGSIVSAEAAEYFNYVSTQDIHSDQCVHIQNSSRVNCSSCCQTSQNLVKSAVSTNFFLFFPNQYADNDYSNRTPYIPTENNNSNA